MKYGVMVLVLVLSSCLQAAGANLCSNVSPPYQVLEDNQLTGKAVEQMACIFNRLGLSHQTYMRPWLRCESDALERKIDGIYTVAPKPTLDQDMTFSDPLALEKWYWFYRGELKVAGQLKVAAVRGSNQQFWLEQQGARGLHLVNSPEQLVKLLEAGRIDAFVADESVGGSVDFSQGIQKRFIHYLPLGVYFSNAFLRAQPEFMAGFNAHIYDCQSEKIALSDDDRKALEKISQRIQKSVTIQVVSAIEAQNERHAMLDMHQVMAMDQQWRDPANPEGQDIRMQISGNALSSYLKQLKQDSQGIYSEIFVMDNKGLNVAQSDMTSDYWQGDEAKFQNTFGQGAGAVFIDDIEFDQSSKTFQSQVSMSIVDAAGKVIGAITVGVDVEKALAAQ